MSSYLKYPGTLNDKLDPEYQYIKLFLVSGFIRNAVKNNIYDDMITLCMMYYDEVMHWKIDTKDLLSLDNWEHETLDSSIFDITEEIKVKWSLDPAYHTEHYAAIYLNTFLPENVNAILLFIQGFCRENKYKFRGTKLFTRWSWGEWQTGPIWTNNDTQFVMPINSKQFKEILMNYYVEILVIQDIDEKMKYIKPVSMEKELSFNWNIDEKIIIQCRNVKNKKYAERILSDTFDEINKNWGLILYPMDNEIEEDIKEEDKKVLLKLGLYKRPLDFEEISVKCMVENSYNNEKQEALIHFTQSDDELMFNKPLFKSSDLFNIDSFSIKINIQIVSIKKQDQDQE